MKGTYKKSGRLILMVRNVYFDWENDLSHETSETYDEDRFTYGFAMNDDEVGEDTAIIEFVDGNEDYLGLGFPVLKVKTFMNALRDGIDMRAIHRDISSEKLIDKVRTLYADADREVSDEDRDELNKFRNVVEAEWLLNNLFPPLVRAAR